MYRQSRAAAPRNPAMSALQTDRRALLGGGDQLTGDAAGDVDDLRRLVSSSGTIADAIWRRRGI